MWGDGGRERRKRGERNGDEKETGVKERQGEGGWGGRVGGWVGGREGGKEREHEHQYLQRSSPVKELMSGS